MWYLITFRDMLRTSQLLQKNRKGNNSVITCDRATVLAFTLSLEALYQCVKFYLIPFYTLRDMLRTSLLLQQVRREVITCNRVTVLALRIISAAVSQRIKFHLILFCPFRDMQWTNLILQKNRKGYNSINTDDRVMVLAFCIFPHSLLLLYQVSFIYLQYF